MLTERHRRERGHAFYPPAADLAGIPPLYATEDTTGAAKTLHLHYFLRDCDWWIAELDPDTGLAFGYACLHGDGTNAEWGYIDLRELESLHQPAHIQTDPHGRPTRILPHLIVERDLHWTPQPASQAGLPGWRASALRTPQGPAATRGRALPTLRGDRVGHAGPPRGARHKDQQEAEEDAPKKNRNDKKQDQHNNETKINKKPEPRSTNQDRIRHTLASTDPGCP